MKSALSHLLPLAVASACLPADALATGALATGTLTTGTLTTGAAAQGARVWDFRVYLDNAAIGTHRFTLRQQGEERELASEARFEVKLMFFTAYRYAHRANERWRGDCLTALNSRTDDNGTPCAVAKEREALPGCIMSFALGVGLFGSVYLMPVFLAFVRDHGALEIGRIMLVTGAAQLVTAPIAITIYFAWSMVDYVDSRVTSLIPDRYNPNHYLPFAIPGLGVIALRAESSHRHDHGVIAPVRTYEAPIDTKLEDAGFESVATVTLLLRETLVRVAEPALVPATR